jgi:hypothetical protein
MREQVTIRRLTESQRADVSRLSRKLFFPGRSAYTPAAFSGRLPRFLKSRPQIVSSCRGYENPSHRLEFSATIPANVSWRDEFRLGVFPPDHHIPPRLRSAAANTPIDYNSPTI